MRASRCARAWQAEAVEDGRLSDADAASFRRHAATCRACSEEMRALSSLREAAARIPVAESTALERRRQRNRLLSAANALVVEPRRAFWAWPAGLAIAAAAAVAPLLWLAVSGSDDRAPAAAPPSFRITTSDGAEWETVERSSTIRVSAGRGRFELLVDALRPDQRFLLDLPDGEIEVLGTHFVVNVDERRTRSVRVVEGRVALRLRGRGPLVLHAGESWSEEPVVVKDDGQSAAPAASAPEGAGTASSARVSRRPAARRREPAARPDAPSVEAPQAAGGATASPPGTEFSEAMSAFSAGSYERAEALFARFEADHPADARTEDATFLRAVARLRRGDSAGARSVAREYLRLYPNGLRRKEAERMVR